MSRVRLDTFLMELRHQVDSFEAAWRRDSRKDPKEYPLTQANMLEWHDRFQAWLEIKNDPNGDDET